MARQDTTLVWVTVLFLCAIVWLATQRGGGSRGGVQFESVRKHPFDVFADPYHPPERENPYLFGRDYSYQQVGLLKGDSSMMPLFGRPHPNASNRWEYYTMNGGIKLPISIGKKKCNSDTGCPELMGNAKGDFVDVLGIGEMRSFLYDTEQLRR